MTDQRKKINEEIQNWAKECKKIPSVNKAFSRKRYNFTRINSQRIKRVPESWRKPRGLQYARTIRRPKIGYKSPEKIRFRRTSGLLPVVIHNVAQLYAIKKDQFALISTRVGARKREILLNVAKAQHKRLYLR